MRLLITCLCLCIGFNTTAHALSCMRLDAAMMYRLAEDSPQDHYAILGQIDFGTPKQTDPAKAVEFPASFTGKALAAGGFTLPLTLPLTIRTQCVGPWCGMITPNAEYLAVIEDSDDGFILHLGACPSTTLYQPTAVQIAEFVACADGKTCEAQH